VANLDSGGHQRFVVDAPAFAARPSTDPRLINLHIAKLLGYPTRPSIAS